MINHAGTFLYCHKITSRGVGDNEAQPIFFDEPEPF